MCCFFAVPPPRPNLSQLEKEVAVHAAAFIGTHLSSITQDLAYERMAMMGPEAAVANLFWETMHVEDEHAAAKQHQQI
jgi:hypothetical protein